MVLGIYVGVNGVKHYNVVCKTTLKAVKSTTFAARIANVAAETPTVETTAAAAAEIIPMTTGAGDKSDVEQTEASVSLTEKWDSNAMSLQCFCNWSPEFFHCQHLFLTLLISYHFDHFILMHTEK